LVVPHVPNMGTTIVAIDSHMVVMQVQVEKNTMEDVQPMEGWMLTLSQNNWKSS
jgi:hypothetical protein